jgi:hypothetical protein
MNFLKALFRGWGQKSASNPCNDRASADGYYDRANIYAHNGEYDEAIAHYTEARFRVPSTTCYAANSRTQPGEFFKASA